jgi:hypothetical protein
LALDRARGAQDRSQEAPVRLDRAAQPSVNALPLGREVMHQLIQPRLVARQAREQVGVRLRLCGGALERDARRGAEPEDRRDEDDARQLHRAA